MSDLQPQLASQPWLLAISTSHGVAEVCACSPTGGVVFEFAITDYKMQSAKLLPMLQNRMRDAGLLGAHALAIAVNVGPGGFTSLRTACGVAQGLCVAWGKPCITASSFEIMWADWLTNGGEASAQVLCLLDAKLQTLYSGYSTSATDLACPPDFQATIVQVNGENIPFDLTNTLVLADEAVLSLLTHRPAKTGHCHPSARGLSRLALAKWARGELGQALDAQPMYIREKVAQTTAERLAAKHG